MVLGGQGSGENLEELGKGKECVQNILFKLFYNDNSNNNSIKKLSTSE